MNVKSERVHALAREAARRSGLSQTSVVEEALKRYVESLPDDGAAARAERVRALVVDFNASLSDEDRAEIRQASDDLYDDHGLFT